VVVAEGDFEARSIGSYSVRAYGAANPRFPFDDFIAGTVRPRDGTIDHIGFSDLDRDGSPEIVVIGIRRYSRYSARYSGTDHGIRARYSGGIRGQAVFGVFGDRP
jgi:hypothetical protein